MLMTIPEMVAIRSSKVVDLNEYRFWQVQKAAQLEIYKAMSMYWDIYRDDTTARD